MWRIQVLLMYFILTTMLVGSNNVCKKYRNGIHKENEFRNEGYTNAKTIQSLRNMYCKKFDQNTQGKTYNGETCPKLTDKYLRLVGETEDDINKPIKCMGDVVHNTPTRETVFVQFYYNWFKNQLNPKGCNCDKVVTLYNSKKSYEARVKVLKHDCL
ncbi:uncharacterized protein LOC142333703 isoform X3 [Lycorma delicatula]|uniref:uncharacterized protein LOC142333703 isoform X3 n=1 Tax=Lycorma delicatula TaxID=130591 RepID=UPI003F5153B4